jgi:hypothetical protein
MVVLPVKIISSLRLIDFRAHVITQIGGIQKSLPTGKDGTFASIEKKRSVRNY